MPLGPGGMPLDRIPHAFIYISVVFAVPNNNTTVETAFDSVLIDTDGFWSSGNPRRLVIPPGLGGLYRVTSQCNFASNSTNHRGLYLVSPPYAYQVGADTSTAIALHFQINNGGAGITVPINVSTDRKLTEGMAVSQILYQNSGGNLNTNAGSASTWLELTRLGSV